MSDAYLAIAEIAEDADMRSRVTACAAQQMTLNNLPVSDAPTWVSTNRYVWASSPSWGEKWEYAKATHVDEPGYKPGRDASVITDGDILATVQHMAGVPSE